MAKMQPQRRSQQNACTIMKYYEKYFDIIRDIFKNENIPSSYYSFFECVEGAVCIILVDYNEWHICNIERGNKYREKTFSTIIEVCYEMISRISDDSEKEISMKTLFDKQIIAKRLLKDHISFLTAAIRKKSLNIQRNGSISRSDLEEMNTQKKLLLKCLKKCEASCSASFSIQRTEQQIRKVEGKGYMIIRRRKKTDTVKEISSKDVILEVKSRDGQETNFCFGIDYYDDKHNTLDDEEISSHQVRHKKGGKGGKLQ